MGALDYWILDSVSVCIRAAFQDLKIPKLNVNLNKISEEYDVELVSEHCTSVEKFEINDFPCFCTIGGVYIYYYYYNYL